MKTLSKEDYQEVARVVVDMLKPYLTEVYREDAKAFAEQEVKRILYCEFNQELKQHIRTMVRDRVEVSVGLKND